MKQPRSVLSFFFFLLFTSLLASTRAADRPNFLWILSEDSSKHFFKLFDESGAPTPTIARLAEEGIAFTRAFSCSPVCSVARTTLMSSVYAPRIGTQFHRKIKPVELPDGWRLFPAYLREAGYYTSNNSKTDFNVSTDKGTWDESSRQAGWHKRPTRATPFFHMQTFTASHEGSLHFSSSQMQSTRPATDPESIKLADYHPDTPVFRYTYARYHDRIRQIDKQVEELLRRLAAEDLLEDTFIFFFGDHGGVLPGSKGYLRETGLHVPLVVRIPANWTDHLPFKRGSRSAGFVSFVDFGPTVLHLANLNVPSHMDGKPFLGPGISADSVAQRDETYGYADRFDEKYEFVRSLRQGPYKYIRHYQGYYPDGLQNNYRYNMLAYQEWRDLYQKDQLDPVPSQFFKAKPPEALYNLRQDPYEVVNLASSPDHRRTLSKLRARLQAMEKSLPDLSFYPESYLVEEAMRNPLQFAEQHQAEIRDLVDLADLVLQPFETAEPKLKTALQSGNRWHRYWAAMNCALLGDTAKSLVPEVRDLLNDPEPVVRIRAAEFLGRIRAADPRPALEEVLYSTEFPVVALQALQAVVYLQDGPPGWHFQLDHAKIKAVNSEVKRRLE